MQAHAAHLGYCTAEGPDRDAELTGEIGRIDRGCRIGCDVIVDLLHEPGGSRACIRGAPLRQRIGSKQVVESEQQPFLEMAGGFRGLEHVRLDRCGPEDIEHKLSRVKMGGGVRDANPQCVGAIEPAAIPERGREHDQRMMIDLRLDEMAIVIAAQGHVEARVEIHSARAGAQIVAHRQDHHAARRAVGGVEDARKRSGEDDPARRQVHDRPRGSEIGDVERNAPGIFQRLGRSKRIDIGKPGQLEGGGRGESVEEHASGRMLQCDNKMK